METAPPLSEGTPLDRGLRALCGIAAYYRIGADPVQLGRRELALGDRLANEADLIRAAKHVGLKARLVEKVTAERLTTLPATGDRPHEWRADGVRRAQSVGALPAGRSDQPRRPRKRRSKTLRARSGEQALLIARQIGGAGVDPRQFGMRWFLPTLWRYRRPLGHVLAASLFVQVFALATPLFFQVVVDKSADPSWLRDLVRARRRARRHRPVRRRASIFAHLRVVAHHQSDRRRARPAPCLRISCACRFPISKPGRPGRRVARVRELETIRSFLTGQALFSALDLVFAFVFVGVLFAYSWSLTLIVLAGIPFYVVIGFSVRRRCATWSRKNSIAARRASSSWLRRSSA